MRRAVVVLCALAFVVVGCGRGDDPGQPNRAIEPQNTASSPAAKVASDAGACRLLTSKERTSIAGTDIDTVVPAARQEGSRQCRWVSMPSKPLPALSVMTSSAQTWVVQLPRMVDSLLVSGRAGKRFTERLQAAKKKVIRGADKLSDSEACEMFSLIVGANGGEERGATELVVFLPTQSGQIIAIGQKCTRGIYTSVTYEENDLAPSEPLIAAMSRLVGDAHKRAIEL
jgi:hypothetical protein